MSLDAMSWVVAGPNTYYLEGTKFARYKEGESIEIGAYCSIADNVSLVAGGNHTTKAISTYPFDVMFLGQTNSRHYAQARSIKIGNDVWIGWGAIVLDGSVIGDGAVIGAGSVVSGHVPPYAVVYGNPASVARLRFTEEQISKLLEIAWWNWPEHKIKANVDWFYKPVDEFIERFYCEA